MQIVPMRVLKDTVKIEKLCSETRGPVFVTKNGYGKLVVMDIVWFEDLLNKVYEAKAIYEGLASPIDNSVKDGKDLLDELKIKYGL